MTEYTPCGGCGATEPLQRCIGCFHDFGGSGGSLTTARDDALEEAKQIVLGYERDTHQQSRELRALLREIADEIEALKGSKP